MPDGESIRELLESVGWGAGATHMALYRPCSRCGDTRTVGDPLFPLPCPECSPVEASDG